MFRRRHRYNPRIASRGRLSDQGRQWNWQGGHLRYSRRSHQYFDFAILLSEADDYARDVYNIFLVLFVRVPVDSAWDNNGRRLWRPTSPWCGCNPRPLPRNVLERGHRLVKEIIDGQTHLRPQEDDSPYGTYLLFRYAQTSGEILSGCNPRIECPWPV